MSKSSEPQNHHPHTPPHRHLGKYLKSMRQRFQESLGETSGAVEIEVEQLDRFERGAELPSEDVLMLLISHFGLQDDEAVELWEMAGYDSELDFSADRPRIHNHAEDNQHRQNPPIMLLAFDNRVLYSSDVEIASDAAGVILSFMQTGPNAEIGRYPVSRIGMSHEQIERLIHDLQQAQLRQKYASGPKQLPPPQQS